MSNETTHTPPSPQPAVGGPGCNDQLGPLLEEAAGECLAALAGVDTYDVNLRDHPTAWAAIEAFVAKVQAAERERWQRIATNAQAVTTGGEDRLDYFEVPAHLMAALALALDEGPNTNSGTPPVA